MKKIYISILAIFALTFSAFAEELEFEIELTEEEYEASMNLPLPTENKVEETVKNEKTEEKVEKVEEEEIVVEHSDEDMKRNEEENHKVEIDLPEEELTKDDVFVKPAKKYLPEEFEETEEHSVEIEEKIEEVETKVEKSSVSETVGLVPDSVYTNFYSVSYSTGTLSRKNLFELKDDPRVTLLYR